jgi:hypothetical protein
VARAGLATAAVGLVVGLHVPLLALALAVADRTDARHELSALARAAGVGSAACSARPQHVQGFVGLDVALRGSGHHENLRAVYVLGRATPRLHWAMASPPTAAFSHHATATASFCSVGTTSAEAALGAASVLLVSCSLAGPRQCQRELLLHALDPGVASAEMGLGARVYLRGGLAEPRRRRRRRSCLSPSPR